MCIRDRDGEVAKDALELFDGVDGSAELTGSERVRNDSYRAQLQEVVETDDVSVLGSPDAFFFGAAYFILFELTGAHPGVVPPPFPQE